MHIGSSGARSSANCRAKLGVQFLHEGDVRRARSDRTHALISYGYMGARMHEKGINRYTKEEEGGDERMK